MDKSQQSDYIYWLDDLYKEAHISACSGSQTRLCIPSALDGNPVTEIFEFAFNGAPVESVDFSECIGLERIGEQAFADCIALTDAVFPTEASVSIGESAFSGCSALRRVVFQDAAQEFGDCAFENCVSLEDTPNLLIDAMGYGAFSGCRSLKCVSFSDAIQTVPGYAFQDCVSLTEITLPEGITAIGSKAFAGCTGLKRCNIPESVQDIGYDAFRDCPDLILTVCPGHYAIAYAKKHRIPFILDESSGGNNGALYDALWEVFQGGAVSKAAYALALPVTLTEERFGTWIHENGSWIMGPGNLNFLARFRFSANTEYFLQNGLPEALIRCATHPDLTNPFSLSFREPCLRNYSISSLETDCPQMAARLGADAQIVSVCDAASKYAYNLYFAVSGNDLYILEDFWYD